MKRTWLYVENIVSAVLPTDESPLNPDYGPIEMGEGDSIVAAFVKVL